MKKILLLLSVVSIATAIDYHITNKAGGDIWIGIQGNPNFEHLEGGGFVLNQGQEKIVKSPDNWNGRFWARTYCDPNSKHCRTGDCGNKVECNGAGGTPPATLVEITQLGSDDQNFYDISLVDGFNLPASIRPVDGNGNCKAIECAANINEFCPNDDLKVMDADSKIVIGCRSACATYGDPKYCCAKPYETPDKCNPDTWGDRNTAKVFKEHCPDAYSYAYDDKTSTFTCKAQRYDISFG